MLPSFAIKLLELNAVSTIPRSFLASVVVGFTSCGATIPLGSLALAKAHQA